ncbi:MAG: hypothetical protein IJX39_04905 [Clostridia bacterium]|nr:hypothetical protein [Clostridia bacterium]
MANFDSGVSRYIKARAVVEVSFPVDWRGNIEIACKHCQFFDRAKQRCNLTQQVVNFPDKFVGECCPLERVEEREEQGELLC